jgi:hypothetical protein
MKKAVLIIAAVLFLSLQVFGISIPDLDRLVDFSITLKDLQTALDKKEDAKISRSKYLILDGTVSVILPAEAQPYKLTDKDILNPKSFMGKFKARTGPVAKFLHDKFPKEYQVKLAETELTDPPDQGTIKELLTQINNAAMPRKGAVSLYGETQLRGEFKLDNKEEGLLPPGGEAGSVLTDDEIAFWNRLLLEMAFPGELRSFSIEVELIKGEWDKNENVNSYRCKILFTGSECFKLFTRRVASSLETIPLNTKALIIARPVKPVPSGAGDKRIWYLEGLYLRSIK